jgi:hypothetical protein
MEDRDSERDDQDRESFIRWQKFSIEQLGQAINLILTLAIAELAFAIKLIIDAKTNLPQWTAAGFRNSLMAVGAASVLGLLAILSRTADFRHTVGAAKARWEGRQAEHQSLRRDARIFGHSTWILFNLKNYGPLLLAPGDSASACGEYMGTSYSRSGSCQ